jgi:uncharacterized protein YcbX
VTARVSELWIHPIKSCRGIAVAQARVEPRGFADDRRFMLVDDSGQFITQREEHRLALVEIVLDGEHLRLSAPDQPPAGVPRALSDGERVRVQVWRSECEALVGPREMPLVFVIRASVSARTCRTTRCAEPSTRVGHRRTQDGYPFC